MKFHQSVQQEIESMLGNEEKGNYQDKFSFLMSHLALDSNNVIDFEEETGYNSQLSMDVFFAQDEDAPIDIKNRFIVGTIFIDLDKWDVQFCTFFDDENILIDLNSLVIRAQEHEKYLKENNPGIIQDNSQFDRFIESYSKFWNLDLTPLIGKRKKRSIFSYIFKTAYNPFKKNPEQFLDIIGEKFVLFLMAQYNKNPEQEGYINKFFKEGNIN